MALPSVQLCIRNGDTLTPPTTAKRRPKNVVGVEVGAGATDDVEASESMVFMGCMLSFIQSDGANLCLRLMECMIWGSRVLWSMAIFVVTVLHHGGRLERIWNGSLCYLDDRVKECDPVDVDFVSHKGLEDLGKGIGYLKFKAMYWQEPSAIEFEDGLHLIERDSDINEMCDFTMNNNLKELHIYFEHPIDNPITPEVLLAESSSSSNSYESAEDEAYKPPPPGYDSDDSEEKSPRKARKGKFVSPVKQIHIPRRRLYTGKRKKAHILSGCGSGNGLAGGSGVGPSSESGSAGGFGPTSGSGAGPSSGSGSGGGIGPASGSATGLV
ncbi:hypothetical protein PIB30_098436 [Stylosanthes scabra]|uniref:PB1-like domain-containing protein n=1 Tax=Stylosanthes scabra TaxID=79078 RepID=A0ABU6TW89_9FABA|nr:hypothetical protein [Stylosanthes scabra]